MNLLKLINELPTIIRKSSERQKCLNEIINELKDEKVKCAYYAARAISIICQDLNQHQGETDNSLENYTKFIIAISAYNDEKHEKFMLQNLKFFVYFLINKNAQKELDIYFEKLTIEKIFVKDSYRLYFDIVKNFQFYLLQKNTQSSSYCINSTKIECCFKNLQKCMEVPDKVQFLTFFKELFDHESSFATVYKNYVYAKDLMHFCFKTLKNLTDIQNFNDFYILITKIFLSCNKYEILLESKVIWSIELMQAIVENDLVKDNVYHHYSLTLLLYISSLRVKEHSQSTLKEIFRKQLKLLENNQNTDWYYDAQLTLIELFSKNTSYILNNIEEENLKLGIEMFYKITKNFFKFKYTKVNCFKCKKYQIHQITNLFQIFVDMYEYVVKLEYSNETITVLLQHILECIKKDYSDINQCNYMKKAFKNKLESLQKIILKINIPKNAKLAVDVMNTINCELFIENLQDKINFIKLYLHLYAILEEKKYVLQSYAAILKLLSNKDNDNIDSIMFRFIKQLIDLNMTEKTIKDILENCNNKFLYNESNDENNINYLIKKQLEIIITYKLYTSDKIEYLFEKVIDENSLTNLEFIMLARGLEQLIVSKKLYQKFEYIKLTIEKCNKKDFEKYLILGHLYKYEVLHQFDESKKNFDSKITNEDNLTDINISSFKNVNLEKECETIKLALNSLNYFDSVYKCYEKKYDDLINFKAIIDDLSYLARNFQLRGYLNFASNAWILLYKFAEKESGNELHKMRVISFFCKYLHYNLLEKYDLNLETELNNLSEKILEQYKKLENLSPRRQNYVLLCLLNMAYYYGYKNDIESLQALVQMVQVKINNMEGRKNKFELVRAHLFSLEFNFRTKNFAKLNVSPYMLITNILKELKQIVYITSEDSLNMSCFLIEFLEDISSYLFSMLDTKMIISFITYVLTFSLQYGITLRIAKLFIIWIKINLQNEDLYNTQLKLLILEKLLLEDNSNSTSIDKYYNEAIKYKKNEKDAQITLVAPIEEARKAVQSISLTEDYVLYPKYLQQSDFVKYLIDHNKKCMCNLCKFPIYKFVIFEIGYCYFQMNILKNGDESKTNMFIEEALKWWSKIDESQIKILFEETLFYLYLDYIKCLRINGKYSEAIQFCDIASKLIENNKNFHNNMIWKIMEHYYSIESNSKTDDVIIIDDSPTLKPKQRGRPKRIIKI